MLALLAIVALASRGGGPDGGSADGRAPTPAFWDYFFTGWVVAMALGVLAVPLLIVTVWRNREDVAPTHARPGRQSLAGIVFLAIVLAVLLGARSLRERGLDLPTAPTANTGLTDPRAGPAGTDRYEPEFQWLPAVVLVAVAVAAVAYFVVRRRRDRRRPQSGDETFALQLAEVVDDALDDLRAEPDPRRAVIAAYARMERTLAARGTPREQAEAPLEYLDRASHVLRRRYPGARRLLFELTHLFERAKFSAQTVDAAMKDDAIATLTELRDELTEEPG